jgi:hypothetical protein
MTLTVTLSGWDGPIITTQVYFSACFICSVARRALTAERRCLGRRDDRPCDVHTQCVPPGYLLEGLSRLISDRQPSIKCIVFAQIMHARLMITHIACELTRLNSDALNGAMVAICAL